VLLTGGSQGMGRSAARQLAAKGANVIIVSRNVAKLEEAVAEMKVSFPCSADHDRCYGLTYANAVF
jgi:short-subunit dehydrogenase